MSANVRAGYKQTDIGIIPKDWETFALGEIATTSSGTTPARNLADRYYRNGTIHWVKTLDLNNSELECTNEQVTLVAVEETSLRPYPIGTVLVAMYGGFNQIGRTGLLRISAAVNQAITAIQPRASKLHSEYLLATLNFRVGYWKEVASSSRKDPNITSQDVRAFPISIPSLPEQRAIAAALSDVDALLAKLDALIAKKRDLKQAAMQQLLTGKTRLPGFSGEWVQRSIASFSAFVTKGATPTTYGFKWVSDGVIFLRSECVAADGLDLTQSMYISEAAHKVLIRGEVRPGDILITITGNVGRIVTVNEKIDVGNINQHIARIRVIDTDVSSEFVSHWLSQPVVRHYYSTITTGQAYPQLSLKQVRETLVPLGAIDEQTAIATILSDMDAELVALEARRDKTRALKQGMMQELLTGRIRLV